MITHLRLHCTAGSVEGRERGTTVFAQCNAVHFRRKIHILRQLVHEASGIRDGAVFNKSDATVLIAECHVLDLRFFDVTPELEEKASRELDRDVVARKEVDQITLCQRGPPLIRAQLPCVFISCALSLVRVAFDGLRHADDAQTTESLQWVTIATTQQAELDLNRRSAKQLASRKLHIEQRASPPVPLVISLAQLDLNKAPEQRAGG